MSGLPSPTPPPPPPHLWGCDNKLEAVDRLFSAFIAARQNGPLQVSLRCCGGPVFHVGGTLRRERLDSWRESRRWTIDLLRHYNVYCMYNNASQGYES